MDAAVVANLFSLGSLVVASAALYLSYRWDRENKVRLQELDKNVGVDRLENKLYFILSILNDIDLLRLKVEVFQEDLRKFCKCYKKLDELKVFGLYSYIYTPITNDGEDIKLNKKELYDTTKQLIVYLKKNT